MKTLVFYILIGVTFYNCNRDIKGGRGVLLPYIHDQSIYHRDTRLEGVWEQYGIFENFKVIDTVANKERLGRRFFHNSFADGYWDDNDTYDNNIDGIFSLFSIKSNLKYRKGDHPIFDSMINRGTRFFKNGEIHFLKDGSIKYYADKNINYGYKRKNGKDRVYESGDQMLEKVIIPFLTV